MKNISVLFLLVIAILTISCDCKNNKKTAANKDTVILPVYEDYKAVVDSTEIKTKDETVFVDDKDGNLKPLTDETGKKFYIIVGSFKAVKNAEKLMKHFKENGFNAEILPKTNEYNRVAVASFDTKDAAKAELKNVRKDYNDASFWLFLK